jgi:hypothetical protein
MPGLEIDQRRALRRGSKMGWYYITAGSWLQLLMMCCCTFIALFPVFLVARFSPPAQGNYFFSVVISSGRLEVVGAASLLLQISYESQANLRHKLPL